MADNLAPKQKRSSRFGPLAFGGGLLAVIAIGAAFHEPANVAPAVPAADIEGAIRSSDNFDRYGPLFVTATQKLIDGGKCNLAEIREWGGWYKSTTNQMGNNVYFTYCGGSHQRNKIHLDANTGKTW